MREATIVGGHVERYSSGERRPAKRISFLLKDFAGLADTYYCCMKQGIRVIDKTDGDELEINLGGAI
jgi:hypothetical protein